MKRLFRLLTQGLKDSRNACAAATSPRDSKIRKMLLGTGRLRWLFSRTAPCDFMVSVSFSARRL